MHTFGDISEPGAYAVLPQIPVGEIRIEWIVDFWDGPRSGVVSYRGERCWFQVVAENDSHNEAWYRRFAVVRLTPPQVDEERRWEDLFREKVGYHPNLKPRERWSEFYEPYQRRSPLNVTGNEALGWFEH